jgi:hypothetical protein
MALAACCASIAAALAFAAPGAATHLGSHPCPGMRTRSLVLTSLQSNFSCTRTHTVLRHLLSRGLRRLPRPTTRIGRWGCGQAGPNHICSRYLPGGALPERIRFRARPRRR